MPPHLRDAHYAGRARSSATARATSTRTTIRDGVAAQQYPPDALVGRDYYPPTDHGAEAAVAERLAKIEELLGRDTP